MGTQAAHNLEVDRSGRETAVVGRCAAPGAAQKQSRINRIITTIVESAETTHTTTQRAHALRANPATLFGEATRYSDASYLLDPGVQFTVLALYSYKLLGYRKFQFYSCGTFSTEPNCYRWIRINTASILLCSDISKACYLTVLIQICRKFDEKICNLDSFHPTLVTKMMP